MLIAGQIGNEWRLLCRHPVVWLAVAGAVVMSAIMAAGSPAPPGSTPAAALLRINLFLPAFILPFVAAALGPIVFLREVEHEMGEIVGSYPLTVRDWLAMRLTSMLALLLGACLLAQLAMLAVLAADEPATFPELLFRSMGWLLVIHLPACAIWACLLARLSCATGHSGLLYFAAGFGWLSYILLALLTGTPLIGGSYVAWEPLRQALLVLDPYAITALASPMPESGMLQSRTANIAAGRMAWLIACWFMLRGIVDLPARSRRTGQNSRTASVVGQPRADLAGMVPGWVSHLTLHLRHVLQDKAFPLMVAGLFLLLIPEVYGGLGYAEPLATVDADSRDALNRVMWELVPLAMVLVLLYTADRVCRMYGALRLHELVATTPYRSSRMVGVQVLALWFVAFLFLVLVGLAVAAAQLAAGSPLQGEEYVLQLGLALPRMLLFGMAFVGIHALIKRRFVANVVCLMLIVLSFSSLAPTLGLHHPLWRPLAVPLSAPDHLWGFESSIAGYLPFLGFWSVTSLALVILGMALYHRGVPFRQVRWNRVVRNPALVSVAVLVALGGVQGHKLHSTFSRDGLLETPDERAVRRADYERGYSRWIGTPQPDIGAVRFRVDLYPSSQRAELSATMTLVNRSDRAITHVLVGRNRIDWDSKIRMKDARSILNDARLGQQIFRLDQAMQPGETRQLEVTGSVRQSGFEAASMPFVLRPSFSSVPGYALLPVVGFVREFTLRDPEQRRALGLPALDIVPPSRLPAAGARQQSGQARLETVITTDGGDYAIAPGELVQNWQENGRNHFLYRSAGAMRNLPAFYSLPWRPQTWKAGAVVLEAYAPQRLADADPNLRAMRETLEWLSSSVTPYPSRTLRLIVVPEAGLSGYALPQTLQLSHRLAVRARPKPGAGFSQVYRRAAHETAHQWFGHLIGYGIAEERGFLVESLAKYAELVMVERHEGPTAMRALVDFEWERYRKARLDLDAPVVPLIDAEDAEDMYSRATVVFACLRQELGDEPILKALRTVISQSEASGRPVRSVEFVDALVASSRPEAGSAIRELLIGGKPLGTGAKLALRKGGSGACKIG